jgi:hypothetical protein
MNRKVTLLAVCLVAVLAIFAVVAAMSSASMILPVFSGMTSEATGTSGSGALSVEGGATIKCASSGNNHLVFESGSRHLGSGTINFSTCTEGGEKCFSLGGTEASQEVVTTGTWHLVLRTVSSADSHLFLFLVSAIHIECPKAAVKLFLISGDVAGLISQKAGSTTAFGVTIATVGGAGKVQEYSEFENELGTGVKTALAVGQEGSSKTKAGFEESKENVLTFDSTTSIEK